MDWGKGIVVAIVIFIGIILTMVVISVRMEGIELVRDNYYEAELVYQNQIDMEESTRLLDRDALHYDNQAKRITLNLPVGATGTLAFYRPSDAALDRSLPVHIQTDSSFQVSIAELKPGYWRVQLHWSENGVSYYQEKKINR